MRVPQAMRVAALTLILIILMPAARGLAASRILIDGQFGDWNGKAHLEDTFDDTKHHWDDVRYWYWATNDGESAIFFMIERFPHHFDGDAVIHADYYPKYLGFTGVSVFVRTGFTWSRVTYGGFWGKRDSDGGMRCEFPVPFATLSIEPGQSLRLVLFAQDKRTDPSWPDPVSEYERLVNRLEADRVPNQGDLQWSPVSTLGRFGWLALVAAGVVMPAVAKRRQVPGGQSR